MSTKQPAAPTQPRVSTHSATAQRRVTAYIMNGLAQGDYARGGRIPTERQLASQLGVSRTAVRDAVKTMCGLGLLEQRHGSGTFVASTSSATQYHPRLVAAGLVESPRAIADLFEARILLECQTAAWAARRLEPAGRRALVELKEVLEANRDGGDLKLAFSHDELLHRHIARAAQNAIIEQVMEGIWAALNVVRTQTLAIQNRAARSYEEHLRVLNSILDGSEEAARAAMYLHLRGVVDDLERNRSH